MSKPADELSAAVAALAADAPPEPGTQPSAEELIAYHRGDLDGAEEARIRDHLMACPEDLALLLDLERLEKGELGAERPISEVEIAAGWRDLRTRLGTGDVGAADRGAVERRKSRRPRFLEMFPSRTGYGRPPRWLPAVAASFLLATVGLSVWVLSLRRTVAELARPQLNAAVVDLYAVGLRGGEAEVAVVKLGHDDRVFNLVLNPGSDPAGETEYELEIVRTGGGTVWSGKGLRRNRYGSLSLTLSRRLLPAGDYRLRLYGSGAPSREPAAEFALRVEDLPEGG